MMIKCSECGKDISDKAPACVGCGAPVAASPSSARLATTIENGVGELVGAFSTLKGKVVARAEAAVEQGKELLKSKPQQDAEAIERLEQGFGQGNRHPQSASEQRCARFQAALESTIDVKFAEIMSGKPDGERFLTYVDGQILTGAVRNVFKNALGVTPSQVEASCNLSEAILAPSSEERERLVKAAVGVGGGAAGIGMIIAGIGGALGWGAGVITAIGAFFTGTSLVGPIGWAVAGVTVAAVAAYFATTSNKHSDTERFLKVLRSSTGRATAAVWAQHEEALGRALESDPKA